MVTTQSRFTQDKRKMSRLETHLDCHFKIEGTTYKAVILDLSFNGALLSSAYLPPAGSSVSVIIQSEHLKQPLILEGDVKRHSNISGSIGLGRFGIEISSTPLDLKILITTLLARKRAY